MKIPKRTYNPEKYEGWALKHIIEDLIKDYTQYELSHVSLTTYYLAKQTGIDREKIRQAYFDLRHPDKKNYRCYN